MFSSIEGYLNFFFKFLAVMNSAAVHNCILVWIWDKFSNQLTTLNTWLLDPVFWLWKTLSSCVIKWPYIHPTSSMGGFFFLIHQQWILSCIWSLVVLISVVWYLMIFTPCFLVQFSSVQFSCSVMSDSLWPHALQQAKLPFPSPTPGACSAHVHRVSDAIQPSYPLSSPSPPAFDLSQHQGLFKWVSSSHQEAKDLELQLQRQSFQ